MGFMRAFGRPPFAYSNDGRSFLDRITAFCGGDVRVRRTGEYEDSDGMAIEPFALHDNLMFAGGIVASGGCIVSEAASYAELYTSLAAFERWVACAAAALLRWQTYPGPWHPLPGHRRPSRPLVAAESHLSSASAGRRVGDGRSGVGWPDRGNKGASERPISLRSHMPL
jgi:hypothetical protein